MRRLIALLSTAVATLALTSTAAGTVLRVGSYHGIRGQFKSIQAAVDAAKPGDWILIGPGDYKTSSSRTPPGAYPGRARQSADASAAPRPPDDAQCLRRRPRESVVPGAEVTPGGSVG